MPEVFAGLDRKQLMIYGGLGAAGVAVVVYLRYKAGQQAPADQFPQAPPDVSGGGGGGGGIPTGNVQVQTPNQSAADNLQLALGQAEVDAAKIQNQYMQEQLRQNTAAFNLQQQEQQQELTALQPAMVAYGQEQAAESGAQAALYGAEKKQIEKTGISCPGNASARVMIGPDGTPQWYCRQKTSGGILGIPIGQAADAISNFFGGVQQAAGQAGQQAGQAAGSGLAAYIRSLFPAAVGTSRVDSGAYQGTYQEPSQPVGVIALSTGGKGAERGPAKRQTIGRQFIRRPGPGEFGF